MGIFSTKKKTVRSVSIDRMIQDEDIVDVSKLAVMDALTSGSSIPQTIVEYSRHTYHKKLENMLRYTEKKHNAGLITDNAETIRTQANVDDAVRSYVVHRLGSGWSFSDYQVTLPNHLLLLYMSLRDSYAYSTLTNQASIGDTFMYLQDAVIYYTYDFVKTFSTELITLKGNPQTGGETYTRTRDMSRPITPYIVMNESESQANGNINFAESFWVYRIGRTTTKTEVYVLVEDSWVLQNTVTDTVDDTVPPVINISYEIVDSSTEVSESIDTDVKTVTTVTRDMIEYTHSRRHSFPNFIKDGSSLTQLTEADAENYEPSALTPNVLVTVPDYVSINAVNGDISTQLVYQVGTGFDLLDAAVLDLEVVESGNYYPRIFLRYDGESMNTRKGSSEYKANNKLASKLNINYSQYINDVHESVGSIGKVRHAFIDSMFLIEDIKANDLCKKYAFHLMESYFLEHQRTATTTGSFTKVYKDRKYSSGFTATRITKRTYNSNVPDTYGYVLHEEITVIGGGMSPGSTVAFRHYHPRFYQVKDGVRTDYTLTEWYSVYTADGSNVARLTDGDDQMFIPFDRRLLHLFEKDEINQLAAISLHTVFVTVSVVKIKWYQRGAFKAVIQLVALIIAAVITVGTGGSGAGAGVALMQAVAYSFIVSTIVSVVVQIAIKVLISLGVSGQLAAVLVIIAAVLTRNISLVNSAGQVTAKSVLEAINSAVKIYSLGNQLELKQLASEYEADVRNLQSLQDKLDDLQLEMYKNKHLTEILVSNYTENMAVGESYDGYMLRTTTVSAVETVLSYIPNYTALALSMDNKQNIRTIWENTLNG